MPHRNKGAPLEWYKLMLILIGAFGIVLALVHWYVSGVDIPNGLLTILTLIISATLGPNAVSSITETFRGAGRRPTPTNTVRRTPNQELDQEEEDSPYPIDLSGEIEEENH